jgi:hypothetical protein
VEYLQLFAVSAILGFAGGLIGCAIGYRTGYKDANDFWQGVIDEAIQKALEESESPEPKEDQSCSTDSSDT